MAIMAAAKGKELWDRLENEPERLYRAFESYLALSSGDRTILEACRGHVGNPEAVNPRIPGAGGPQGTPGVRGRPAEESAARRELLRSSPRRASEAPSKRTGIRGGSRGVATNR